MGTELTTRPPTADRSERHNDGCKICTMRATSAKDWVIEDVHKIGSWEYTTLKVSDANRADVEAQLNELSQLVDGRPNWLADAE